MHIGKNLIRLRISKNWSQEYLAHESGMSQSNYSKIESNKQEASETQIQTFAQTLGVSVETLINQECGTVDGTQRQTSPQNHHNCPQVCLEPILAAKDETIAALHKRINVQEAQVQLLNNRIFEQDQTILQLLDRIQKILPASI